MALPSFISSRRQKSSPSNISPASPSEKPIPTDHGPSQATVKRATRTRLYFSLFTSFCFLVTLVFLILVEVGNTSATRPVVGSIWFLKLDLSDILPNSVPDTVFINTIARSLGLHDFYQVGLWNYCEGYGNEITNCSPTRTRYWFDPVSIIKSELLAGASISLPTDIATILDLVKQISHWMFGLFLLSAPLSFLCMLLAPLSIYSRWITVPIAILTFLCALTTTAACVIATALFVIFRNVIITQGAAINIHAEVGVKMFAFMWIAVAGAIVGWLVQMGSCCCCASRRDVQTGKKVGRRSAYADGEVPVSDQVQEPKRGRRRGWLGKRKE